MSSSSSHQTFVDYSDTTPDLGYTYNYLTTAFTYDHQGHRPIHIARLNHEADRDVLHYRNNRLRNPVGGDRVSRYTYTVNEIGQRTDLPRVGSAFAASPNGHKNTECGYDARGQLTLSDTGPASYDRAYSYDDIGNPLTTTRGTDVTNFTANDLNQLTDIAPPAGAPVAPEYDADGNATALPLPVDALPDGTYVGSSTLVWNGENRLISATTVAGVTTTFTYDHLGRRTSKSSGTTETEYVYDGSNRIAQYVSENGGALTLETTYTWGMDLGGGIDSGGVGGLLQVTDHNGSAPESYYPTYDGNGNVSEYLDATGATVAHYEYDPFGDLILSNGAKADDFEYRFSTKPLDEETRMYYYRFRHYHPELGRWASRDPIQERGGVNLYGFVGNEPVGRWDSRGLKCCCGNGYNPPEFDPATHCCNNGSVKHLKDRCRVSIFVGHFSFGGYDSWRDSSAERIGLVRCYSALANSRLPADKRLTVRPGGNDRPTGCIYPSPLPSYQRDRARHQSRFTHNDHFAPPPFHLSLDDYPGVGETIEEELANAREYLESRRACCKTLEIFIQGSDERGAKFIAIEWRNPYYMYGIGHRDRETGKFFIKPHEKERTIADGVTGWVVETETTSNACADRGGRHVR